MANRIRKQWEQLGASDPYWAVLTHPGKKGQRWGAGSDARPGERDRATGTAAYRYIARKP